MDIIKDITADSRVIPQNLHTIADALITELTMSLPYFRARVSKSLCFCVEGVVCQEEMSKWRNGIRQNHPCSYFWITPNSGQYPKCEDDQLYDVEFKVDYKAGARLISKRNLLRDDAIKYAIKQLPKLKNQEAK